MTPELDGSACRLSRAKGLDKAQAHHRAEQGNARHRGEEDRLREAGKTPFAILHNGRSGFQDRLFEQVSACHDFTEGGLRAVLERLF